MSWYESEFFYDKEIIINIPAVGSMVHGVYQKGTPTTESIACDVQPTSADEFLAEFGYSANVQYKVYCDPNDNIKLINSAIYNDVEYNIEKVVNWDDYTVIYLASKEH